MAELLDVLKSLDPNDDSLWTDDGLPALDAVKALSGDKKLTRQALNDVALGLTRTTVASYDTPPAKAVTEVTVETKVEEALSQDDVKAELELALAAIEEARTKASSTEAELFALQQKVTALDSKLVKPTANEEFAESMSHYITATAKERMERADKLAKLEELGLSVDDLKELFPQLGMR